jgi:hypothetical protein
MDTRKEEDRMFVVQYGGRIRPSKYYSCVVHNDWRLVGEDELYNLTDDPGQENNIVENFPEVASKMRSYYEDWWSKVEPTIDEMVPVIIHLEKENSVIVTSNTWTEVDVDNVWRVLQAQGDPKGGIWNLDFKEGGSYTIELSRWPFHLNLALTDYGPETTVGGLPLTKSVALPIQKATLLLDGAEHSMEYVPGASSIPFKIETSVGETKLQAWFSDEKGNPLCGAYYMRISM